MPGLHAAAPVGPVTTWEDEPIPSGASSPANHGFGAWKPQQCRRRNTDDDSRYEGRAGFQLDERKYGCCYRNATHPGLSPERGPRGHHEGGQNTNERQYKHEQNETVVLADEEREPHLPRQLNTGDIRPFFPEPASQAAQALSCPPVNLCYPKAQDNEAGDRGQDIRRHGNQRRDQRRGERSGTIPESARCPALPAAILASSSGHHVVGSYRCQENRTPVHNRGQLSGERSLLEAKIDTR